MRKFYMSAVIVSVLGISVAVGQQRQAMIAQEEVIELLLLRQKPVQDELKLSGATATKARDFTHKQHEAAEEVHKLPEAQQKPKWEKMMNENEQFLASNLTPAQRKRLEEISIQCAGLLWVTRPAVARELQLTDTQKQQAKKLQLQAQDHLREVMRATGAGHKEKLAEFHKTSQTQLASILTEEQKTKLHKLAGAPFTGKLNFEEP